MPATPGETELLEYELSVAARPETVFEFFTDPEKMVGWMGDEATLDPRPGGICRIGWTGSPGVLGEFVEVLPHSRVVFTWGWEAEPMVVPPASTIVEVSLVPEGDGTRLRLTHRRLPEAALDFHRIGWEHYLARLEIAASGGDPGPHRPPVGPEAVEKAVEILGLGRVRPGGDDGG